MAKALSLAGRRREVRAVRRLVAGMKLIDGMKVVSVSKSGEVVDRNATPEVFVRVTRDLCRRHLKFARAIDYLERGYTWKRPKWVAKVVSDARKAMDDEALARAAGVKHRPTVIPGHRHRAD